MVLQRSCIKEAQANSEDDGIGLYPSIDKLQF